MELDFEKLVKLAEASTNPQVSTNALSISDVLKNGNAIFDNVGKIMELIDKVERSPIISSVARAQFQKAGIEVKPFNSEPVIKYIEVGIKPASPTHEKMFIELNKMPEAQLQENLKKYTEENGEPTVPETGKN